MMSTVRANMTLIMHALMHNGIHMILMYESRKHGNLSTSEGEHHAHPTIEESDHVSAYVVHTDHNAILSNIARIRHTLQRDGSVRPSWALEPDGEPQPDGQEGPLNPRGIVDINRPLVILNRILQNSIAFGKSTSQRIYPKQHTPKIG